MGYRVIWTDEAIDDLRRAVAFIAKDNPTAAVKLGEAIIQKSLLLAEHPRLGRGLRKLQGDSHREIPVSRYRLIYEVEDPASVIYVPVLWHGARQEPDIR